MENNSIKSLKLANLYIYFGVICILLSLLSQKIADDKYNILLRLNSMQSDLSNLMDLSRIVTSLNDVTYDILLATPGKHLTISEHKVIDSYENEILSALGLRPSANDSSIKKISISLTGREELLEMNEIIRNFNIYVAERLWSISGLYYSHFNDAELINYKRRVYDDQIKLKESLQALSDMQAKVTITKSTEQLFTLFDEMEQNASSLRNKIFSSSAKLKSQEAFFSLLSIVLIVLGTALMMLTELIRFHKKRLFSLIYAFGGIALLLSLVFNYLTDKLQDSLNNIIISNSKINTIMISSNIFYALNQSHQKMMMHRYLQMPETQKEQFLESVALRACSIREVIGDISQLFSDNYQKLQKDKLIGAQIYELTKKYMLNYDQELELVRDIKHYDANIKKLNKYIYDALYSLENLSQKMPLVLKKVENKISIYNLLFLLLYLIGATTILLPVFVKDGD